MEKEEQAQKWNPKGGRPPMKAEEKRGKWAGIRLTDGERERLQQLATEAGYRDLSEFMRRRLLSEENAPIHNPKKLFLAIDQMGGALKKIGANINQFTRYVHYLEKNSMVEPKVIGEFNRHFREFLDVEEAYVKAIRAYLRTVR